MVATERSRGRVVPHVDGIDANGLGDCVHVGMVLFSTSGAQRLMVRGSSSARAWSGRSAAAWRERGCHTPASGRQRSGCRSSAPSSSRPARPSPAIPALGRCCRTDTPGHVMVPLLRRRPAAEGPNGCGPAALKFGHGGIGKSRSCCRPAACSAAMMGSMIASRRCRREMCRRP
jgi:hypothetical protein